MVDTTEQERTAVFSLDIRGNIITANLAFAKITGYSLEQLYNKSIFSLVPLENIESVKETFRNMAERETIDYEFPIIISDTSLVELWIRCTKIALDAQTVSYYGIAKEYTDQIQLKRIAGIFERLAVGFWCYDFMTKKFWCTLEIKKMNGFPDRKFTGKFKSEYFIHPDDLFIIEKMKEKVERGEFATDEFRIIRSDGKDQWVQSRGEAYLDESGKVSSMGGVFLNITNERKKVEKKPQMKDQLFQSLFENYPDAICTMDLKGNLLNMNRAFEQLAGFKKEGLLGKPFSNLAAPEDSEKLVSIFNEIKHSGLNYFEFSVLHKNDPYRKKNVKATLNLIMDEFIAVRVIANEVPNYKKISKESDLGQKLRMLMEEKNINAKELSFQTGLTPATISNLRRGRISKPQNFTLNLIAEILGVQVSDIW